MPELDCDPDPRRHLGEEILQPRVVALLRRGQLDQEDTAAVRQFMQTGFDAFDPYFGLEQFPGVRQPARRLHRKGETRWHFRSPAGEGGVSWPMIETAVQFNRPERCQVMLEPSAGIARGVEDVDPVLVAPP